MSSSVPIGELRHRLVLETPARASDGGGGADVTWQTVAEVWAALRPLSGGESFSLDRVAGRLSHEIFIRHRDDVTLAMRFREGTHVYDLRAAFDPDGRRQWLRCLAEERDL
jgi:SPP1 family predicted phage head-tail adaptor